MKRERIRLPTTRWIDIFRFRRPFLVFVVCVFVPVAWNDGFPPTLSVADNYSSHSFGSRFVMKSDMRLAAGGSMLDKTTTT